VTPSRSVISPSQYSHDVPLTRAEERALDARTARALATILGAFWARWAPVRSPTKDATL
jgi:hypothetical protein